MTQTTQKMVVNGITWFEDEFQPADILIGQEGRVDAVGRPGQIPVSGDVQRLDAAGKWVLPGGIDMHAHLEDGAERFFPGSCAAASGGITTFVDMPPFHVCASPQGVESRVALAESEAVVDFCQGGGIVVSAEDLAHIEALAAMGLPYFKVFMPAEPPVDSALLWKSVQAAARSGLRLALHAEETGCFEPAVNWQDPLGFARARPAVAETSAVAQVLEMAAAAGAPVHICHVSCGRSAELIGDYKAQGVDVTAETTPHYLILDDRAFITLGSRLKTTPPLRRAEDSRLLWEALEYGVLDAVVSDHFLSDDPSQASVDPGMEMKEGGIAGLELTLPLLYHHGVSEGRLSLDRFVQVIAINPARILRISHRKGSLVPGKDADLLFFDPQREWELQPNHEHSRIATTPYQGWDVKGKVLLTIVRGNVVWDGNKNGVGKGFGKWVVSNPTE